MVDTTFASVDEQMALLTKGIVDLFTADELRKKLERSRKTGQPLTVKVGFDPTAPDIHIGHAVLLRKMHHFQQCGHRVVFLIGDFTGLIGDPTGRSAARPALTEEQIAENAETYKKQCFTILDPETTEIRFNSEWLNELGSVGFIRLAARYNVARMLERKDFKKRYLAGQSISLHEFLYPLAQAYDSVELKVDVELGGTDQLFNLNVGRDIMPGYGLEPQVVMTTPLLEGIDGTEKMSKSLGNYIGVEEAPRDAYGKLMSITDELMWRYYELCTDVSMDGIESMKRLVREGALHPKKAKEGLALRILTDFHDEHVAMEARQEFERVFANRGEPDDVPEHTYPATDGKVFVPEMVAKIGLAGSTSEGRRLLTQGAVAVDGRKLGTADQEIAAEPGSTISVKVGKRRFAKVTFE